MSIMDFLVSQIMIFALSTLLSPVPMLSILFCYVLPIIMTVLLYKYKKKFAWFSILPPIVMFRIFTNDPSMYLWSANNIFLTLSLVLVHFTILVSFVILIMFLINKIKNAQQKNIIKTKEV